MTSVSELRRLACMGAAVLRLRDAAHRPESYSGSSRRALRTPSGRLEISWIRRPARPLRSHLPRSRPSRPALNRPVRAGRARQDRPDRRGKPAVTLVFAGHELDPRRQELRREGEVVHVEPQVFDLLTFLIRNRDRIVSKDEILDTIWDGRIVSEAALSSRINAARKAIGDSGNDQIFIRTFHKRGFRFVADATELSDDAPPPGAGNGARPQAEALAAALPAAAPVASDQEHGKPSIAVVPFQNLSQDSEHEYFAYGLTEDVVRLLGRNRWLTVMTRHTTAPGRGSEVDARALGAALGVRYLVEGSVRRHGERVRITAGLVSADTGTQLWSEVYDLHLADIFDIQDAMAKQIAAVIEPELASHEQEIAHRKAPES